MRSGDRAQSKQPPSSNGEVRAEAYRSPQEILAASGSADEIREQNVSNALKDFFGM